MTKKIVLVVGLGVGAALAYWLVSIGLVMFVVQPVRFEGTSMMPTYKDGDRLVVEKLSTGVERGDVVVFHYPRDPKKSFVKRVIGLPGERIEIRDGVVRIDGVAIDEPYVSPQFSSAPSRPISETIPEGHVFVIGDNRDHSNDSRAWGPLPVELIYGKVVARYG